MRWMALDHGTKKIGIAFSDEMEILASPFAVWSNCGSKTLTLLAQLAINEEAHGLVVGVPLHKDGTNSSTAEMAIAFGRSIHNICKLPLIFWNEHLTSAEASYMLAQRRMKSKNKKSILDAAAAAVILQDLIETRRAQGTFNQSSELH
jgi:putative Holliday junction resolvase